MGKDLVYLPAFYCNGKIIPAGAPFHLRPDNSIDILTPRESHQTIAVNHVAGAPFYEKNQQEIAHLAHCRFIGSNTPDFSTADTLGDKSKSIKRGVSVRIFPLKQEAANPSVRCSGQSADERGV